MKLVSITAELHGGLGEELDRRKPIPIRFYFGNGTAIRIRGASDGENTLLDDLTLPDPVDMKEWGRTELRDLMREPQIEQALIALFTVAASHIYFVAPRLDKNLMKTVMVYAAIFYGVCLIFYIIGSFLIYDACVNGNFSLVDDAKKVECKYIWYFKPYQ